MKYTCIIIRYNLRVRNFLTKGLGTRTYSTFQRERKSETIMLISNCAELLALFLKKSITYFFNARSFYLDLVQNQPLAGQQRWTLIFMSLVIGLPHPSEKISSVFSSWSRALLHMCTYFGFIPSSSNSLVAVEE